MTWSTKWPSDPNYEIGYRRPPRANQFKRGVSGNPKGRKQTGKTLGHTLQSILAEPITIREGDKLSKMPRSKAILHGLVVKAIKGDANAYRMLLSLAREYGEFSPEPKFKAMVIKFVRPDGLLWTREEFEEFREFQASKRSGNDSAGPKKRE